MSKKLYVGNLPYSITEVTLRDLFAPVGEVASVSIITDRETGRAKGFAFVEMASETLAQQAMQQINGKSIEGRTITVAEARPQAPRSDSFGGGGRGGYGGGGFGRGEGRGGQGRGRMR